MRHRGPDETGTWADGEVVFGFNRLSIIDLEHSHQPLSWGPPESPNRYTLVFNGEIYNYLELRAELIEKFDAQFNTDGDGEVIVAAYHYLGEASVSRLRGMCAFLIWDSERRVVFGARDPFGIKPLFYASGPGGVAFASEKKSLLDLAPQLGITPALDTTALQHYLILQYVPEPESLQQTIRRITGRTPTLFRPPYGEVDEQVRADERRLGLLEVLWTVDSQDWNGAGTDEIVQAASTLQPGGIILMHDGGYQTTVDAVPRILRDLARRGLCPGRIAYTPRNISGVGQIFHAVAVAP